MKGGDVKGMVPTAGEWFAVYAKEGRVGRRPLRASDFGTEPVLFWIWTEAGDVASFVGVVPFGSTLIVATDPYLLGYARKGENLRKKFGLALRTLKKAERAGGYPEAERETLADLVRSAPANDNGRACPKCGLKTVSTITGAELARGAYESCPDCGSIRDRPETIPCAACVKGFGPDGEVCDICAGSEVLPSVPVIEGRTGRPN